MEADVICVTEGSNHTTDIKHLQSWNIAESYATRQGAVSPTGSKTVAWYQTEFMGTRETQYALPKGVINIKPMNGKILQMAFWESDQFVVLLKQGNSCIQIPDHETLQHFEKIRLGNEGMDAIMELFCIKVDLTMEEIWFDGGYNSNKNIALYHLRNISEDINSYMKNNLGLQTRMNVKGIKSLFDIGG